MVGEIRIREKTLRRRYMFKQYSPGRHLFVSFVSGGEFSYVRLVAPDDFFWGGGDLGTRHRHAHIIAAVLFKVLLKSTSSSLQVQVLGQKSN